MVKPIFKDALNEGDLQWKRNTKYYKFEMMKSVFWCDLDTDVPVQHKFIWSGGGAGCAMLWWFLEIVKFPLITPRYDNAFFWGEMSTIFTAAICGSILGFILSIWSKCYFKHNDTYALEVQITSVHRLGRAFHGLNWIALGCGTYWPFERFKFP